MFSSCNTLEKFKQRRLTLSTCGSFPALLADTSKRIPTDYTGTTIMTGVWQAAAVPCYNRNKICHQVVRKPSKLSQEEKPRSQIQCCICFLVIVQGIYLYYKWLLPILQDTYTWKCPPHHNMFLHCCMLPHRTGCHLWRSQTTLNTSTFLMQCNKFKQPNRACLLCFGNAELTGVASFSFPPIFTFTEEVVDQVSASSSIVARVFTAVINI